MCFIQIFLFIMVIMFSGFLMTSINRKYDYRFYTHLSTYFIYVWSIGDVVEEITSFFVSRLLLIKILL